MLKLVSFDEAFGDQLVEGRVTAKSCKTSYCFASHERFDEGELYVTFWTCTDTYMEVVSGEVRRTIRHTMVRAKPKRLRYKPWLFAPDDSGREFPIVIQDSAEAEMLGFVWPQKLKQ